MNASESLWILLISSTCFVALDLIQYQPSFYMAWNGPTGKNKEFLIKCNIRFSPSQTHSPLYSISMDLGGVRELLNLEWYYTFVPSSRAWSPSEHCWTAPPCIRLSWQISEESKRPIKGYYVFSCCVSCSFLDVKVNIDFKSSTLLDFGWQVRWNTQDFGSKRLYPKIKHAFSEFQHSLYCITGSF